ncbi:MAG: NADP-dependent isocitrate dehydrogenase, partial [Bacteroidota bacterium]
PDLDLVIIRENEEDLYAGIEHQQTNEVVQCLKLITRPGCEKIIRYAFEFARAQGRSKVTCMSKDNIMKQTDGLFHQVFQEIGAEYPEIQQEHLIIDIGSAKLASNPEQFDVIVTLNLYGDILSDIAAQISGSVGLSGSANIGTDFAMFEAVHGSAPDIAGQNLANPSGLIQAACMMLTHLGKTETADLIQKALLYTLEEGIHTGDIYDPSFSKVRVGTREFTEAVIHHLGKSPRHLKVIQPGASLSNWMVSAPNSAPREAKKELVGIDVFLDWSEAERDPDALGKILEASEIYNLKLKMITNRGVKVYPQGHPETFCTDHWRCRFVSRQSKVSKDGAAMYDTYPVSYLDIIDLLRNLYQKGLEVIKTENLYLIDGKRAYSLGQGE